MRFISLTIPNRPPGVLEQVHVNLSQIVEICESPNRKEAILVYNNGTTRTVKETVKEVLYLVYLVQKI